MKKNLSVKGLPDQPRKIALSLKTTAVQAIVKGVTQKMAELHIPFRLNCKYIFLTYPQCPLEPKLVIEKLGSAFGREKINKYLIVSERHKDGTPHIHAWIELCTKCDIKNLSKLYLINGDKTYKGSFQQMRSPQLVLKYVQKYLDNMQQETKKSVTELKPPFVTNLDLNASGFLQDPFYIALGMADEGKVNEALEHVKQYSPRVYAMNWMKLKTVFEWHAQKSMTEEFKFTRNDFIYPEGILRWYKQRHLFSLYLSGKANIGKTRAMHALLLEENPTIIRHIEDLRTVDWSKCKALIFDDVCFAGRSSSQKLNLLDVMQESSIRVLYSTVRIPAGIIRVYTSNNEFREVFLTAGRVEEEYNLERKAAILRRTCVIHTEVSFFKDTENVRLPEKPLQITEAGEEVDKNYVYSTVWKTFEE